MLFSYWDALRGDRAAPERGEIEPGEIRHILADAFILELDEDRQAEFRLGGTRLCALFGRELKGRPFPELWPEAGRTEARRWLDIVTDETAGLVAGLVGTTQDGATVNLEMLLLPLRHRGKTHTRIMGALSPALVPSWMGLHAITHLKTVSVRVIWPSPAIAALAPSSEATVERRRGFVLHQGGRP
jgi:hypothetical protein